MLSREGRDLTHKNRTGVSDQLRRLMASISSPLPIFERPFIFSFPDCHELEQKPAYVAGRALPKCLRMLLEHASTLPVEAQPYISI